MALRPRLSTGLPLSETSGSTAGQLQRAAVAAFPAEGPPTEVIDGEATVKCLTDLGYYNLQCYSRAASKPGSTGSRSIGFAITPANRQDMVSAVTVALLTDSVECASEEVVKSLSKVTYVKLPSGRMRAEASYGAHDEDMICMGRFLCLNNTLPMPAATSNRPGQMLTRSSPIRTSLAANESHARIEVA